MPVDPSLQFRKLRMAILQDTLNRKNGAFNRAMWYGGQSAPAQAVGFAKDVGKDVRRGNVASFAVGAAAAATIPVVSAVLAVAAIATIAETLVEKAIEKGADKGSGFYRSWKQKTGGTVALALDEQTLKDSLSAIERNLTKLHDAKVKAKQAADALNLAVGQPANAMNLETMARKGEEAMRTSYEVGHYQAKLTMLTEALASSVAHLRQDLAKLDDPLTDHINSVEKTTEAILKACLAAKA